MQKHLYLLVLLFCCGCLIVAPTPIDPPTPPAPEPVIIKPIPEPEPVRLVLTPDERMLLGVIIAEAKSNAEAYHLATAPDYGTSVSHQKAVTEAIKKGRVAAHKPEMERVAEVVGDEWDDRDSHSLDAALGAAWKSLATKLESVK